MSHVVVFVLGDIGRSPRMQYHAVSFASQIDVRKVTLIGYDGTEVIPTVKANNKIKVDHLKSLEFAPLRIIPLLHAIVKGLLLMVCIFTKLWSLDKYDLIIIQNPPCLPVIIAASAISLLHRGKIMIDWHNLGFTMYESKNRVLVSFARMLEQTLAHLASHHICVSSAMKEWLLKEFNVSVTVLHDAPPAVFSAEPLTVQQRHDLFSQYQELCVTDRTQWGIAGNVQAATIQTVAITSTDTVVIPVTATTATNTTTSTTTTLTPHLYDYHMRNDTDRAALVVSATSWTADEDFTILLRALLLIEKYLKERKRIQQTHYENSTVNSTTNSTANSAEHSHKNDNNGTNCNSCVAINNDVYYNKIVVVVTGKGPMKTAFELQVQEYVRLNVLGQYITVHTLWLEHKHYPLLMRAANLGVCLHTSTSGLDLPMKVYDMLGSGTTVCAIQFDAIAELVRHNENGVVFRSSEQLAEHMIRLLIEPKYEISSDNDVISTAVSDGGVGGGDNDKNNNVVNNNNLNNNIHANNSNINSRNSTKWLTLSQLRNNIHMTSWSDNWNANMSQYVPKVRAAGSTCSTHNLMNTVTEGSKKIE